MLRMLLVIGFALGCLRAEDTTRQKVQTTTTERMDFAPGGVLRLKNSVGTLTVDGWDRPEVEITTIKITKSRYSNRADGEKVLGEVKTAIEHNSGEVVITTDFVRTGIFKPPFKGGVNVDLTYQIKAPRDTKLIADHDRGGVVVSSLASDINVTVHQGEITVYLPVQGQYVIDAKSKFGAVSTTLPGHQRRSRWIIGESFASQTPASPAPASPAPGGAAAPGDAPGGAHKLYLRVGGGDILIFGPLLPLGNPGS